MNNENMSSGKGLTLVKTKLLPGQERVTVVASLPTNPSCDVTANIPIVLIVHFLHTRVCFQVFFVLICLAAHTTNKRSYIRMNFLVFTEFRPGNAEFFAYFTLKFTCSNIGMSFHVFSESLLTKEAFIAELTLIFHDILGMEHCGMIGKSC